ncbi:MAG: ribonuclease H-like domain-containing protein [Dehalococcoidia bacterium]
MVRALDAYLDIETTGLSFYYDAITVVGIYLCNSTDNKLIQLVGRHINRKNLLKSLENVQTIYTYNGKRFDIPFIERFLGIDLLIDFSHYDLMYDCWKYNLRGGFKAVERQLKIPRQLQDINGAEAVVLWKHYRNYGNRKALELLLQYNKEDVVNLKLLREKLADYQRQSSI